MHSNAPFRQTMKMSSSMQLSNCSFHSHIIKSSVSISRIPAITFIPWYLCRRIKKGFHHTSIILLFLTVPQNLGWSYYSSFSRVEGSFLLLDVKNTRNFIRSAQSGRINSEGTYFKLDFARARDFGVCLASPSFPFNSVRLVLSIGLLSCQLSTNWLA